MRESEPKEAASQRGAKVFGRLVPGYRTDGTPIEIEYISVNGQQDGNTLFVTGGVHGNEVAGMEVVRRIAGMVDPHTLKGTLLCVPCCNRLAFASRERHFVPGLLPEPRDINRVFPGKKDGSVSERVADMLFSAIVKNSNYGVDLHNSAFGGVRYPYAAALADNPTCKEQCIEMARASNAPVVFVPREFSHFKGWLAYEASRVGCPTVLFEWGEPNVVEDAWTDKVVGFVKNVMGFLGMLSDQEQETRQYQLTICEEVNVRCTTGGLVHPKVKIGETVSAGQTVAEISDFYNTLEEVKTSVAGIVLRIQTHPATSGDRIAIIGVPA